MIFPGVTYNVCPFSKSQIDNAGLRLIRPRAWDKSEDIQDTLEIINSFRGAHNSPLLVFRVDMTTRARKADPTATVAQRLKRLPSIEAKLRRLSTRLTQMEDIGGCRAVVRNVAAVRRVQRMYESSRSKHELARIVDYIARPKDTGYRGVHLIYVYQSTTKPAHNGYKIELQLRTRHQHAWATAVETVDIFAARGLKIGTATDDKWQRFFALMGSYISNKEGCIGIVPGTPSDLSELKAELQSVTKDLSVKQCLESYRAALKFDPKGIKNPDYYLLQLNVAEGKTYISGYKQSEFQDAQDAYLESEAQFASDSTHYVVLVSVGSLESLKRAYPNYFADTGAFLSLVDEAASS